MQRVYGFSVAICYYTINPIWNTAYSQGNVADSNGHLGYPGWRANLLVYAGFSLFLQGPMVLLINPYWKEISN